jgi:glycosyltransferase involved in cell wall biosynthesis
VVDGETGVLVDPCDHLAVAEAVTDLLLDRERARRLAEAGVARAQALSWRRATRQVEDVLLEVSSSG